MTQIDKILADINSLEADGQMTLLSKLFPVLHKTKTLSMEFIQIVVCNYYGILPEQIQSKTRRQEIVLARFLIMYFSRRLTKYSSTTIGIFCGGRDHATVLYACEKIEKLIQEQEQLKSDIDILLNQLMTN